jgi:Uma2 family endonuclease
MATIIHDAELERRLQSERAACGADRYDEVWEGVYVMAPMPNDEHQMIVNALTSILQDVIGWPGLGQVRPGVNVSNRVENWQQNYRVPDVAVFLNGTKAVNHSAFWLGGPDLAVDVISPGDQTREKLGFYANVSTREVLVIDRDPWQLELYRLTEQGMRLVSTASAEGPASIGCETVCIECKLIHGKERPRMQVIHRDSGRDWTF